MEEKTKSDILLHAEKEFPRECCGLVIIEKGKEVYVPCKNISPRENEFILDSQDYIKSHSRGEIISIVHSHCNQRAKPSQIDLVSCETSKLPWHIVSLPNIEWAYLEPRGYKAPILGRQYQYGILDCYTLVVDWYKENLGISLNEHLDRPDGWWETGSSIFVDLFPSEGFYKIGEKESLKTGDIFLMQLGAKVPNHVGIFLEPNYILHHLKNRLSTRDVYGGWYRKNTQYILRHKGEKL